MDFGPLLIAKYHTSHVRWKNELHHQHITYKMKNLFQNLKAQIMMMHDEFMFKYGPERIELARNRLSVHMKNINGDCQFNPYTEPDSDWYKFIDN